MAVNQCSRVRFFHPSAESYVDANENVVYMYCAYEYDNVDDRHVERSVFRMSREKPDGFHLKCFFSSMGLVLYFEPPDSLMKVRNVEDGRGGTLRFSNSPSGAIEEISWGKNLSDKKKDTFGVGAFPPKEDPSGDVKRSFPDRAESGGYPPKPHVRVYNSPLAPGQSFMLFSEICLNLDEHSIFFHFDSNGSERGELLSPSRELGKTTSLAFHLLETGDAFHKIYVSSGRDTGLEYELAAASKNYVIGRSHECDWRLSEPTVSGRHLEVHVEGTKLLAKDLGSTHKTIVDGKKVDAGQWVEWEPGRLVKIGALYLQMRAPMQEVNRASFVHLFPKRLSEKPKFDVHDDAKVLSPPSGPKKDVKEEKAEPSHPSPLPEALQEGSQSWAEGESSVAKMKNEKRSDGHSSPSPSFLSAGGDELPYKGEGIHSKRKHSILLFILIFLGLFCLVSGLILLFFAR